MNYLLKVIGYFALTSNLISCLILALLMRLLHKITQKVKIGTEEVENKQRLSFGVTGGHILLTICYTITSILAFNVKLTPVHFEKALTAWTCIGAFCDIFLTCMMWFIFDTDKETIVFRDRYATYAVLDVIKQPQNQSSS